MTARDLATLVVKVTGVDMLDEITADGFDLVMDRFVAAGFRDPAVPAITAAQLACLDDGRRRLGLNGRQFVGLVRQLGGVSCRRHLDGEGFLGVWGHLASHGYRVPVPGHGFMDRQKVRLVHEVAYQQRMEDDELIGWMMTAGGVLHAADLDKRGFLRLLCIFDRLGAPMHDPAPIVPASAGMVTQAQANLIWRLWLDLGGWNGLWDREALERAIGSMFGTEGGLADLTRAGARAVIDRFMVPRLNDRRATEAAREPPGRNPPPQQGRLADQQGRRARRRRKGGRR